MEKEDQFILVLMIWLGDPGICQLCHWIKKCLRERACLGIGFHFVLPFTFRDKMKRDHFCLGEQFTLPVRMKACLWPVGTPVVIVKNGLH